MACQAGCHSTSHARSSKRSAATVELRWWSPPWAAGQRARNSLPKCARMSDAFTKLACITTPSQLLLAVRSTDAVIQRGSNGARRGKQEPMRGCGLLTELYHRRTCLEAACATAQAVRVCARGSTCLVARQQTCATTMRYSHAKKIAHLFASFMHAMLQKPTALPSQVGCRLVLSPFGPGQRAFPQKPTGMGGFCSPMGCSDGRWTSGIGLTAVRGGGSCCNEG